MIDVLLSKYLTPSWRTTLGGVGALLLGVGAAASELSSGHWPSATTMAAIVSGWSLLFAKDQKAHPEAK